VPHISERSSIVTARLRLRPMTLDDTTQMHQLCAERGLRRMLWGHRGFGRDEVAAVIERSVELYEHGGEGLWCVYQRDEDQLIGFCGLWRSAELDDPYLVFGLSSFQSRRGYAAEMLRAFVRHLLVDQGRPRVLFRPRDDSMCRLAASLGFHPDPRAAGKRLYAAGPESLAGAGCGYRLVRSPQPLLRES
jgi:RimJ/RimL family protein N-acetyltransferase